MPIARDVVELARKLRARSTVEPFDPAFIEVLRSDPTADRLASELGARDGGDGYALLHLLIQSLAIQDSEDRGQASKVELVATLPQEVQYVVRRTSEVVKEMIQSALEEILIAGYRVTDGALIRTLGSLAATGKDITIILNKDSRDSDKILAAWPVGVKRPNLYSGVANQDGPTDVLFHSKVLIIDSRDMLLTSANFSRHGLEHNFELGVRLEGPPVIEARELFRWAIRSRMLASGKIGPA
ncbi:MAG: hypothetical protein CO113_03300 [Elusimicrobia bacterium CG_4_9_14_3_um_filter_62_55]|nr:MAG: hypothetical protein COR54_10260 [Elusimicrobia bacterium CG22_combo_CG10-13_8_21_14_all_63_91]PJA14315.1 MAG: hypothetical protein COX66_12675 [Elusimicrobia bacterium CG_4_10_14_0_2_um_filter_63_34]PJB26482.1 MAG: hypothetical protein CO113_03300 [Elusimicrobia bacterium CG_4_9_14_3_um_filter_62_55]